MIITAQFRFMNYYYYYMDICVHTSVSIWIANIIILWQTILLGVCVCVCVFVAHHTDRSIDRFELIQFQAKRHTHKHKHKMTIKLITIENGERFKHAIMVITI